MKCRSSSELFIPGIQGSITLYNSADYDKKRYQREQKWADFDNE